MGKRVGGFDETASDVPRAPQSWYVASVDR